MSMIRKCSKLQSCSGLLFAAECLDGWSVVPGTSTCVKAFDVGKSWTEARKSCGENADLVKITDRNMNKFIVGKEGGGGENFK